jgi:hypothetical protein
MTELVIYLPLIGVAEHFIGLGRLLKAILSLLVSWIAVWVIFECQASIPFLYLLIRGVSIYAEHLVIVLFLHER